MKRLVPILAILLLAVPGLPARAASFRTASVPASAQWICHFDFAGLKQAASGQILLARPEWKASPLVAGFSGRFGLDPEKDVRGLTVYTLGTGRLDAVALIDPDPAALARLKAWREKTGWKAREVEGYSIFSRTVGADTLYQAQTPAGQVVAAQTLDHARRGLAVLDGRIAALKGDAWPALADRAGGAGALLLLAARGGGPDLSGVLPAFSLLRRADGLCLALGDKAGQVAGGLTVSSQDETEAERMEQALDALVALSGAVGDNPQALALRNVNVTRAGGRVRLDGRWTAADIFAMLGWSGNGNGQR